MPLCTFTEKTEIQAPVEKVFQLLADTDQFCRSLPPSLRAKIVQRTSRTLGPGCRLEIQLRIFGMAMHHTLQVRSFNPGRHIACIWPRGAIPSWEHDIYFESLPNGRTRVIHCILYRTPWWMLGPLLDRIWLHRFLHRIVRHQNHFLEENLKRGAPSAETSSRRFLRTTAHS